MKTINQYEHAQLVKQARKVGLELARFAQLLTEMQNTEQYGQSQLVKQARIVGLELARFAQLFTDIQHAEQSSQRAASPLANLEKHLKQAIQHNPAFLSEMRGNAPRNQLLADVFVELSQLADKPLAQTHSITRANDAPQHESSTPSMFQAPSAPPEVLAAVFEVLQQFYRSDRSLGQILKLSRKLNRIWLKAYRKERGVGNAAR
ncbi:hypothetical protein HPC37_06185 [Pasteurellaceae bacterium 20609_3]|uniref:hypothetical protein n=1 Tax=Spirabiliibacterium mucosae TaxID=28156 RepID=UPI001AAC55C8|nr:hypothetical protein [Spirabiliibacterium mucosae]MBE2898404.1 hypothetical protein [Spirabiliibacterium mucosae]